MSEMTLEPCPFCGTTDIEVYPTDRERARWNVCCGNPGCVTRGDNEYPTESDAVSAWNRCTHIAQHAEMADRLKLEAQCHAQEARTANATIAEIYQLCSGGKGEPGNWHGAEPVRALLGQHAGLIRKLRDIRGFAFAGGDMHTVGCEIDALLDAQPSTNVGESSSKLVDVKGIKFIASFLRNISPAGEKWHSSNPINPVVLDVHKLADNLELAMTGESP